MNRNIFKLLMAILIVSGTIGNVSAQKRKTLETPNTVIYALPQTVLKVDVIAEKTVIKRGPFADYAKKYLGISDVVNKNGVEWKLKSIKLRGVGEIDPNQYHKITASVDYEPGLIALTPEGLIRGFNIKRYSFTNEEKEIIELSSDEIKMEYGEISINPIIKYRKDTTYKVVETDTAFIKVPVLKTTALTKSLEEKAEEAAHQIFKLRKRRFKILTSNFEVLPPDGKAYEVLVKELSKLEEEYISMFVGKKISIQKSYQFSYTPKQGENGGVIFRMSPQIGPVEVNDLGGRPVRIDFKNLNVTKELAILPSVGVNPQTLISYRIPGMADVSISNGKSILLKERMPIAQFGKIARMPAEILLNENYSIEFYPDLGSIKDVTK